VHFSRPKNVLTKVKGERGSHKVFFREGKLNKNQRQVKSRDFMNEFLIDRKISHLEHLKQGFFKRR
jgi:hypothetical protein